MSKPAELRDNALTGTPARLVVKFSEGSAVRVANGEFLQKRGRESGEREMFDRGIAGDLSSGLSQINQALKSRPALLRRGAVRIERLFSRPESDLDAERIKGMARSGEELADLNLYHVIEFDDSVATQERLALANTLLKLGVIETAYFEPRLRVNAVDIAPTTPSLENFQSHLERAYDGSTIDPQSGLLTSGIDAKYAWTIPGGRGAGTKFVDVEFGWNTNHEDLNGPTIPRDADTADVWHGTAVLGLINAQPNGFGMSGIAPDARYGLVNVSWGNAGMPVDNLALAINRANSYTVPGDVILIEVGIDFDYQAANCTYPTYSGVTTVPVEHYQAVFDAIRNATANGIIVVETASNGAANLDDPCFGNRYNTAFRDSGAIMVGASVKNSLQKVLTSSYGARIDVNAQGNLVATTVSSASFNNLFSINPPDENQQYTSLFDGTSASGAIVAGAILSLQGIQKARNGRTFTPAQMRTLLKTHGTDPAKYAFNNNGIGAMPNLRATIDWLLADADGNGKSNGDELSAGMVSSPATYVVTAAAGANGTVTPASITVPAQGTAEFTATPNAGYAAAFLSGSCPMGSVYGNTYRTGQISANCSVSVMFTTALAAPTNVTVKAGNGSATFQFTPPPTDSLTPIIAYTVTCNGGTHVGTASAPPVRVSGLANGATYACSVSARNSIGNGDPSLVMQVTPIVPAKSILPIRKDT